MGLGCGTGAVGLYAAGCSATRVVLTDGVPEVLDVTRKNLASARASGLIPRSTSVDVQLYRWGEKLPRGAFDWVIGSDLTYDTALHGELFAAIAQIFGANQEVVPHKVGSYPRV